MQKLVLINNNYYQRFHNCNAFYRYDSDKDCWQFISYNTYMMCLAREKGHYIIWAYDYKGATTQKQMSRFISEFCGYGYYKAYRKAREIMRKYNGQKMCLHMVDGFEKWKLIIFRCDDKKTLLFNI